MSKTKICPFSNSEAFCSGCIEEYLYNDCNKYKELQKEGKIKND